jgi:hypothetical protein
MHEHIWLAFKATPTAQSLHNTAEHSTDLVDPSKFRTPRKGPMRHHIANIKQTWLELSMVLYIRWVEHLLQVQPVGYRTPSHLPYSPDIAVPFDTAQAGPVVQISPTRHWPHEHPQASVGNPMLVRAVISTHCHADKAAAKCHHAALKAPPPSKQD